MRILVTGSTGLLGANLVLTAVDRGMDVVAGLHRVNAVFPKARTVAFEVENPGAVSAEIRAVKPDWVVHGAAYTNVDWCEQHPAETERLHVDATRIVAAAARDAGARLLYISTDSVFDGAVGNYREDAPTGPVNVYARTKLEGEIAARSELPNCLVARINLFGWNLQAKLSLGEWVLQKLEKGEVVPGFGDVYFNPILASDLAEILLDLMAADATGVFHVAGGDACSKFEFARAVASAFGHDSSRVALSSVRDVKFAAPRPRDTTLDIGRLATKLGRRPPGLTTTVENFRRTRDNGFLARLKSCLRT